MVGILNHKPYNFCANYRSMNPSITLHIPSTCKDHLKIHQLASNLTIKPLAGSKSIQLTGSPSNIDQFIRIFQNLPNWKDVVILKPRDIGIRPHLKLNKHVQKLDAINNNYTPIDICKIYNLPLDNTEKFTTKPSNIAIIELGGGYKLSDLNTYWKFLKFKNVPKVTAISVDGAKNATGSDADVEVALDIQIAGGIHPNSNIYVYFTPNTVQGFYDAIHAAVYDTIHPPNTISISWGASENNWTLREMKAFDQLFQTANGKGINICVSSGDSGATDGVTDGSLHVDFPASSPHVLACGGTTLYCQSLNYTNVTTNELVWGNETGAAGGGISTYFDTPSYQSSLRLSKRGVPDVCAVADPHTGWIVYVNDNYQVVGGTSAVAPMWAAYLANLGVTQFVNPLLYQSKQSFHDIVEGNNFGYTAGVGFDLASGLGSPSGQSLNVVLSK